MSVIGIRYQVLESGIAIPIGIPYGIPIGIPCRETSKKLRNAPLRESHSLNTYFINGWGLAMGRLWDDHFRDLGYPPRFYKGQDGGFDSGSSSS